MIFQQFLPVIFLILMVGGIISLIKVVRDQQKESCMTRMKRLYGDSRTQIEPIKETNIQFKYRVRDYYIKSSYNSCSCGDFGNGYVNLDALREIIRQGVRCLDFEIYSVGGKAVVAASKDDNFNIKGTFNSLPIADVFKLIKKNACNTVGGSNICPNPSDPLFINLRIKSNKNDIYNEIAHILTINFDNLLSLYHQFIMHPLL